MFKGFYFHLNYVFNIKKKIWTVIIFEFVSSSTQAVTNGFLPTPADATPKNDIQLHFKPKRTLLPPVQKFGNVNCGNLKIKLRFL